MKRVECLHSPSQKNAQPLFFYKILQKLFPSHYQKKKLFFISSLAHTHTHISLAYKNFLSSLKKMPPLFTRKSKVVKPTSSSSPRATPQPKRKQGEQKQQGERKLKKTDSKRNTKPLVSPKISQSPELVLSKTTEERLECLERQMNLVMQLVTDLSTSMVETKEYTQKKHTFAALMRVAAQGCVRFKVGVNEGVDEDQYITAAFERCMIRHIPEADWYTWCQEYNQGTKTLSIL